MLTPAEQLWLRSDGTVSGEVMASISGSMPELIPLIGRGERVMFDDGKITAVVREPGRDRLRLEVTAARGGRARLRGDKGINFPDSTLHIPALTAKDIDDMEFAVAAGDIVNVSFVHSPADIAALHRELHRHRRGDMAVECGWESLAHALMLNTGPNITAAVKALRTITQSTRKASRRDRLVSCLAHRSNCPAEDVGVDLSHP